MLKLKKGLPAGRQGFTLIELLVVIAVMAVIASAVLVLIDPTDKINAANDARVQADVGQVASAFTAYAAAHNGYYPCSAAGSCPTGVDTTGVNALTISGELKVLPTAPSGYTYTYYTNTTGGAAQMHSNLKSKKYTSVPTLDNWAWCNTSAAAGLVADTATDTCP